MNVEQYTGRPEQSQDEQNEALLAQSEVGVLLLDAYREATSLDPRLCDMKIVPIEDPAEKSYGHATSRDVSESGQHEIHIRLRDLDGILDYYASAIRDYPQSVETICQRMHLDPSQITPQILYVQSQLHEMGHVRDYMDHEENMDVLRLRDKQERMALPLGYHSLTKLMDPNSELRQRVDRHWEEVSAKHGVESVEELARVQGEAYRNLTAERNADMFAADVFDLNPQMVDQLSQPSIESYRNFPLAA